MKKEKTLKENITFLLTRYMFEKKQEERKDKPNYELIEIYDTYILELEFALEISKDC